MADQQEQKPGFTLPTPETSRSTPGTASTASPSGPTTGPPIVDTGARDWVAQLSAARGLVGAQLGGQVFAPRSVRAARSPCSRDCSEGGVEVEPKRLREIKCLIAFFSYCYSVS